LYTHVSDIGQILYTQFRNWIEPMYLERAPVNSFFYLYLCLYPVKTHILDSPDPNLISARTVLYTHVSDIGQILYTQFRNCIEPMYLRCLIGLERAPVNSFFHLTRHSIDILVQAYLFIYNIEACPFLRLFRHNFAENAVAPFTHVSDIGQILRVYSRTQLDYCTVLYCTFCYDKIN
jgi:hypothetical protein